MQLLNPNASHIKVHDTLFCTYDVLSQPALDHINQYLEFGHQWHMDRRLARLSFPSGNDIHPFTDIGEQMADFVSEVMHERVLYRTAKIFLDLPGSEVPLHCDADNIGVMSQVYLSQSDHPIPGTTFLQPYPYTVPFKYNCGYLNDNRDRKIHKSGFLINGYRLSIGFQFYFPK